MVRICSRGHRISFRLCPVSFLFAWWCCMVTAETGTSQKLIQSADAVSRLKGSKLDMDNEEKVVFTKGKKGSQHRLHRSRHSVDDSRLLTASLQLRREHACEGQRLQLKCPAHTQLVIESAFFGRSVPYNELCPPQRLGQEENWDNPTSSSFVTQLPSSAMPLVHNTWDERFEDISCDVSNARSKVMEICQYKRKCKINANSRFFDRDPCPMTSKYLQVSYKCRPSRFGSECFSEGSTMELGCKANQRLAIYSAIYGRTVANNPGECLGGDPLLSFDCTIDVVHKLLPACHAQSKCSILVDDSELGSPGCSQGVKKYLNVIFICVREEVFSDSALTGQLGSEESYELPGIPGLDNGGLAPTTLSTQNDASSAFGTVQRPRSFIPPLENDPNSSVAESEPLGGAGSAASTPSARCLPESVPNAVIQVQNWLSTYEYIRENHEKFFLYFGLSASTGIIALLLFCIVQLCWRHRGQLQDSGRNEANSKYSPSRASSKMEVASAHTPTAFDEGRVEMTDLGRDGVSFLRFNHPTPPRNPNKALGTPAVSIAAAPSFQSHEFYS